ncbi:MAG TPA: glycosyltransferase, partial [Solirubrobacteraceae bacterium]|nr:glycosyltransferase [Solirubrobacteraceae bacterium]
FGKPVVAGNVGGALDAVLDGVSGLLVDPTDPAAVGDAITRLLMDRQLAQSLGSAGAERARSLAWPLVAERVQELLLAQLPADERGGGPHGVPGAGSASGAAARDPEDPRRAAV